VRHEYSNGSDIRRNQQTTRDGIASGNGRLSRRAKIKAVEGGCTPLVPTASVTPESTAEDATPAVGFDKGGRPAGTGRPAAQAS
jgi:hypothetical protein